jgi:DNA-binding LacI/PurR family transcriptional regulator
VVALPGVISANHRPPTVVDVARLAGVGTTTVSRVMAGQPQVSDDVRRRVLGAVRALGSRPSAAGRMLRTGKTHVLGVVMPHPSMHPLDFAFYPHVLQGIAACAAEFGYDVLWITDDSSGDDVPPHAGLFKSKRVDGLIDVCIFIGDPRIQALRASGQPFVLIGRPDDTSLPHVDVANREAALQVGREFLRRGYSSVGFIGIKDQPASLDRLAGLQRALAEIGRAMLPHHQVLIRHERERSLGLEAFGAQTVHAWMAQGEPPRAVLTYTDTVAYGVLRACREVGLHVPEDLALVGFDDEPASRYLDPPLASVEQPLHELGYEAALLLLELVSGEIRQPAEKVLPARLIHRASLGNALRVDPMATP